MTNRIGFKLGAVVAVMLAISIALWSGAVLLYQSRPDLDLVVLQRDVEGVKRYIAAGFDVRTRFRPSFGEREFTALHVACEKGFPEIAKILIEARADIDATDDQGRTPLMACVVADNAPGLAECAQLLVAAGADIGRQDLGGNTALHFAANYKCVEIAQMLLDAGADPNQRNVYGATPLHAVGRQFPKNQGTEGVRLLLGAGADPTLTDYNGRTPFDIAVEARNPKIADELAKAMKEAERKTSIP